jgi:hypothetical protein
MVVAGRHRGGVGAGEPVQAVVGFHFLRALSAHLSAVPRQGGG